jgi:hypothetical protein
MREKFVTVENQGFYENDAIQLRNDLKMECGCDLEFVDIKLKTDRRE